MTENAWVAELVDARDLKSLGASTPCRFKSGPRHQQKKGSLNSASLPKEAFLLVDLQLDKDVTPQRQHNIIKVNSLKIELFDIMGTTTVSVCKGCFGHDKSCLNTVSQI